MLAVQQAPRMGSTQPDSDPFLPFGYSVDTSQEPLFDAPEPAPGAPLLSETDSKLLSSFFEDMTANQYNMPSFGEGLNFSDVWLDLPPQFMGTATSFGSQSASFPGPHVSRGYPNDQVDPHGMMHGSQLMRPPPPPPPPQSNSSYQEHHSDDVLNAAATLIQNGSSSRSASKSVDTTVPRRPIGPPVGHLRHQPLEEFREESRKSMMQTEHDHTFTDWMWGSKERRPGPLRRTVTSEYQWGSDSNFSPAQGYTPDTNKETVESMQQEQLKCLGCLEVSKSAATTRPGSPVNGQGAFSIGTNRGTSELDVKTEEDPELPPRKRRKSKIKKDSTEEEEDEDSNQAKPVARRRKPRNERNGSISSPPRDAGAGGKRRKSAANGTKPPRENLTEEQKRENHIRSEQKRRTLIKEGFDDLCEIVPGLKGGSFSKSTMLSMTADWLEELLKGNQVLATQLAAIERR